MGAASSTGSAVLQSSAQQAAATAALPQEILQTVFSSADFSDFLQLSTVAGCSKYVFQTKKAMDAVFTELRLEPTDTEGIQFAPVDRLTLAAKNNPNQAQNIQKRNTQCMKVAYFYIRLFQIYGALAITVLDTVPTRELATGTVLQPGPQGKIRRPMIGGSSKISESADVKQLERLPVLFLEHLIRKRKIGDGGEKTTMGYSGDQKDNKDGLLFISSIGGDESTVTIEGEYRGARTANSTNTDNIVQATITFSIDDMKGSISVNGKEIEQQFIQKQGAYAGVYSWYFKDTLIDKSSKAIANEVMKSIFDVLKEESGQTTEKKIVPGGPGKTAAGAMATTTASSGSASAATQSEFLGLASLTKKLLRDKHFPKAYAVARAMQLLNPALPGERVQGSIYKSDICRTGTTRMTYNQRDKEMPVIDSEANSSIYFVTLRSLFYDKLEIKPDGSPTLSQTSPGREALTQASQQLGALFQFPQQDEAKFLTDKKRIPTLSVCKQFAPAGGKVTPVELEINVATPQGKALVKELQGVVQQLLKHQKEHSARVLQFYQSMFAKGTDGRWALRKEIYRGGIPTVNRLAEQARALLLSYYKKSEALYTIGYAKLYQSRGILKATALSSS